MKIQRFIGILLGLALVLCLCPAVYGAELPEDVRIGGATMSGGTAMDVKSSDGFAVYQYQDGTLSQSHTLSQTSAAQIQLSGDMVSLVDATGTILVSFGIGSNSAIGPIQIDSTIWEVGGKRYRGAMMFNYSGSSIRQINVMDCEQYLYGVLPKEMSASYPLEALKAQAVAARCFAALGGNSHKSSGFDVCTSTHCQVYGGVDSEAPKCSQAVEETRGVYARVSGEPVACYYSANNGGYIEDSADIWGGVVSYLKAKADPYNPSYTWTASFTPEQLSAKLASDGKNIGTVQQVKILARSPGGSVTKIEFVGTNGSAVYEKERARTFLGGSQVKSSKFQITGVESQSLGNKISAFVKDNFSASSSQEVTGLYALSSGGNPQTVSGSEIYVVGSDGTVTIQGSNTGGSVEESTTGEFTGLYLTGQGNGHGIGMSQTGAKVMAEQGFGYQDILKFYFTGIEVY